MKYFPFLNCSKVYQKIFKTQSVRIWRVTATESIANLNEWLLVLLIKSLQILLCIFTIVIIIGYNPFWLYKAWLCFYNTYIMKYRFAFSRICSRRYKNTQSLYDSFCLYNNGYIILFWNLLFAFSIQPATDSRTQHVTTQST